MYTWLDYPCSKSWPFEELERRIIPWGGLRNSFPNIWRNLLRTLLHPSWGTFFPPCMSCLLEACPFPRRTVQVCRGRWEVVVDVVLLAVGFAAGITPAVSGRFATPPLKGRL